MIAFIFLKAFGVTKVGVEPWPAENVPSCLLGVCLLAHSPVPLLLAPGTRAVARDRLVAHVLQPPVLRLMDVRSISMMARPLRRILKSAPVAAFGDPDVVHPSLASDDPASFWRNH